MIRDILSGKSLINTEELEFAVKAGKNILAELMSSITKVLNSSMELDEFSKIYTKSIDNIVLFEEEKTGNKFVGGEFKVFYIDYKSFGLSFSLYFQNDNEEWQKMTAKSNPIKNDYLSKDALLELEEKRTIVYDVEKPTEEARQEYLESKKEKTVKPKRIE